MRIQFLGANRQVTGSRYLVQTGGLRLLVDCGMFQERKFQARNWDQPPFDPKSIDFLLLTHAHLDHSGMIPRLVAQGFDSPIVTVEPTVPLAEIIMLDAAKIQQEDAAYKIKRHKKEHRKGPHPVVPLYTSEDAQEALRLFRAVKYEQRFKLNDRVHVTFHEAGHILGSAFLELEAEEDGRTTRLVFSGDLGQYGTPLTNDPSVLDRADYLVMESTYGNRPHKDAGPIEEQLGEIINNTVKRGGNVVIPTFALERAQELIYYICRLREGGRIGDVPVFLDSPMAVNVTEVFQRYKNYLNRDNPQCVREVCHAFGFPGLKLVRKVEDSIAINSHKGPAIILASSGMCTGGRIKHHLRQNITKRESTIVFVGYQAEGTLGRHILERPERVRIHGRYWPVQAEVAQIFGFSAHGDRDDLLRWLGAGTDRPSRVFLTHGEADAAAALGATIEERLGIAVTIPDYQDSVDLSDHL